MIAREEDSFININYQRGDELNNTFDIAMHTGKKG